MLQETISCTGTLKSTINSLFYYILFSFNYIIVTVRAVLASCVIWSLHKFRVTIQHIFGPDLAFWFVVITASQYHFMFYLSRPLPNILALPLGNLRTRLYSFTYSCNIERPLTSLSTHKYFYFVGIMITKIVFIYIMKVESLLLLYFARLHRPRAYAKN